MEGIRKEYISEKEFVGRLNKESKRRYMMNQKNKKSDFKFAEYGSKQLLKKHADAYHKESRNATLYTTKRGNPVLAVYWGR